MLTTSLPCPALIDGQCSGYAGRPLNCRSYHSLSREACEDSFRHPDDLERGHPQLRAVAAVHVCAQAGFQRALQAHRQDARQFELVTALSEALEDEQSRDRFERGETAFVRPPLVPDHAQG